MKIEVLITSFKRPEYLQWNLSTLSRQNLKHYDYHVTVLNDGVEDTTIDVVNYYRGTGMPIDYLFTGQRNRDGTKWRVPGFAFNIGIKRSNADIVVLSCAEMYHLNESFSFVIRPVLSDPMAIGTPHKVYDDGGGLIRFLNNEYLQYLGHPRNTDELNRFIALAKNPKPDPFMSNPYMPYFMAIRRQSLLDIGGYDEDFVGKASDDNDLMERLVAVGHKYVFTPAEVIHLFHPKPKAADLLNSDTFKHNRRLMIERRGKNVRNAGREWGVPDEEFRTFADVKAHEDAAAATSAHAAVLRNLLPDGFRILDVGCGDKNLLHNITAKVTCKATTVDAWSSAKPDVLLNLECDPLPFGDESYDVVLLMDVIEHLSMEAGKRLIRDAQRVAKSKVFIYTPRVFDENVAPYLEVGFYNSNPFVLHKSHWPAAVLEEYGFVLMDLFMDAFFGIWRRSEHDARPQTGDSGIQHAL